MKHRRSVNAGVLALTSLLAAAGCRTSDAGLEPHEASEAFDLDVAIELTRLNLYTYQHPTDFLDGNTFATSRSTDSEPLVARASVGLVLRYKQLYAGWAQNFLTERFESQPSGQTFGSVVLGYSYQF